MNHVVAHSIAAELHDDGAIVVAVILLAKSVTPPGVEGCNRGRHLHLVVSNIDYYRFRVFVWAHEYWTCFWRESMSSCEWGGTFLTGWTTMWMIGCKA